MASDSDEDSDRRHSNDGDSGSEAGAGTGGLPEHALLFLHALISRRVCSQEVAEKIHAKACALVEEPYRKNDLPAIIDDLNKAIEQFGLAIKRSSDPWAGKAYLVFANMRSDLVAQVGTEYTPGEINYFKAIMTAIMESGDDLQYCLTHNEAMKLSSECTPKISRANAEKLLQSFTRKGWLVRPADSKVYCLSLRSLLELETYLKNEYPDQTETTCVVCDELVTVGYKCTVPNCEYRGHTHCLRDWQRNKQDPKCPGCQSQWPNDLTDLLPIGPLALRNANNTNRRGAHFAVASEASDTNEDDTGPSSRKKKKPAKPKAKTATRKPRAAPRATQASQPAEDEDEEMDELASQRGSVAPTPAAGPSGGRRSSSSRAAKSAASRHITSQTLHPFKTEADIEEGDGEEEALSRMQRELDEMDEDENAEGGWKPTPNA